MKSLSCFVLLPLVLITVAEFVLKASINANPIPFGWDSLSVILSTPGIILSIISITIGGLLWLVAMSKYELSFIYPFLSLNYVAIVIGSQYILGEQVSLPRYLSVIFIVLGLFVISKSPHASSIKECSHESH